MDALELLHHRQSTPANRLGEPAPDGADLDAIVRAGLTAPDHDGLRPWRFLLIRGAARERLGEVFAEAARARTPDINAEAVERQRGKPLRAPLIIAVVARVDPDRPRVPEIEQVLSAGAALNQMQLAANALGYGAIWLTGPNARDAHVGEALGLDFDDRIVGFLYLGTGQAQGHGPRRPEAAEHVLEWHGAQHYETL